MDNSITPLGEPSTPKRRHDKAKSKLKLDSQPTPSRSRKRYDLQRRLEVAETRRNGACAKCREKKVRCSPARHKASAEASPQTSTDTMSNWSRSPRDDDLPHTNNGDKNKDKVIDAKNTLGLEGCVQAAKEYLKVAQSHVEEFARFVEAWESSQKQSTRSKYAEEDVKVQGLEGSITISESPQSFQSHSTIEEDTFDLSLHTNHANAVDNYSSNLGIGTSTKENRYPIVSASIEPGTHRQTMLAPKDCNRPLHPKFELLEKNNARSTKRQPQKPVKKLWAPRLKGENEPWVAIAPPKISQLPEQNCTSCPLEITDEITGQHKSPSESSFEDFEYNSLDDNFAVYGTAMGSEFNFGLSFDQAIPQDLDDPFVSSLMTTEPLMIDSQPNLGQGSLEYPPTAWEATRDLSQVQHTNVNAYHDSLLNDMCFQTPPSSAPSLVTTPWSMASNNMTPLAIQGLSYTPIRRLSEQLTGKDMLEGQNQVLDIDWSFEDIDLRVA